GPLANPLSDAEAMAELLEKRLKFDKVIIKKNLRTREEFGVALGELARESSSADLGMVFFAGHGIEVDGKDYLIATDATLNAPRDVKFQAVSLDEVLEHLEGVAKVRLVVLDACRNNPFPAASRSVQRGLARYEPDVRTLIAYAAKAGSVALDGIG